MEIPLQKWIFIPNSQEFSSWFWCVFLTFLHESIAKLIWFLAPGLDPKVLCFQVPSVTYYVPLPCALFTYGNKSLAAVKRVSSPDDVSGQWGAAHISVQPKQSILFLI